MEGINNRNKQVGVFILETQLNMNNSKSRYVGSRVFDTVDQARDFCTKHGLSWTLIHHEPYKHKKVDSLAG